jgi:hypothetical protein
MLFTDLGRHSQHHHYYYRQGRCTKIILFRPPLAFPFLQADTMGHDLRTVQHGCIEALSLLASITVCHFRDPRLRC